MGARGRRWVMQYFTGNAVLKEFERMYEGAGKVKR